jgi:hypothetical protein
MYLHNIVLAYSVITQAVAQQEEIKYGLQAAKDSNVQKLERLLGGSFTGTMDKDAENPHENLMEKYIEDEMGLNKVQNRSNNFHRFCLTISLFTIVLVTPASGRTCCPRANSRR